MSLQELYASMLKVCEKLDSACFTDSSSQINYLITNFIDFKQDFEESFLPILECVELETGKNLYEARRLKEFADSYKNMAEPDFCDKSFQCLNLAILNMPFEEKDEIFQIFAQRSNLHYHKNDYSSSLADINNALKFRLSVSLIERKVNVLKKLNKHGQAYKMLVKLLDSNEVKQLSSAKQDLLRKLKRELKTFKVEASSSFFVDDEDVETSEKEEDLIQFHENVKLKKNFAQRYNCIAEEDIPSGTVVLQEKPVLMSLRSHGMQRACTNCHQKTPKTFWPCPNCNEVVFCSPTCQQKAHEWHQKECRFLVAMQKNFFSSSVQTYRVFTEIGLENLSKFKEDAESFSLEKLSTQTDWLKKRSDVKTQFLLGHFEMLDRLMKRKPLRTPAELCNSIFLFVIYCYKNKINVFELNKKEIIDAIDFLATSLFKTQLNEYGWHEVSDSHERVQLGNFQCLFGSSINHNCEPNAEWAFDGEYFKIKTTKDVKQGGEIAITYGVSRELSIMKRQRHLQNFCVMCCCARCMEEARQSFAIRCETCNGPILFDSAEFENVVCMQCERSYEDIQVIKVIWKQMQSAKRCIQLINQVDESQLEQIESMMSTLACYLYLRMNSFLKMIQDLCDRYIRSEQWESAIEWFQWFIDTINLYLTDYPLNESDDETTNNEDGLNSINKFNVLKKWSFAYTKFAELNFLAENDSEQRTNDSPRAANKEEEKEETAKKNSNDTSNKMKYIDTGIELYHRLFQTFFESVIINITREKISQKLSDDYFGDSINCPIIIKLIGEQMNQNYNRFKKILNKNLLIQQHLIENKELCDKLITMDSYQQENFDHNDNVELSVFDSESEEGEQSTTEYEDETTTDDEDNGDDATLSQLSSSSSAVSRTQSKTEQGCVLNNSVDRKADDVERNPSQDGVY